MKVLFAVNNEKISEAIIRKYQTNYKEIISAKNVYYFNAIIKELQRDKSYDRVVISEDLEPYSNKNYDMIDKFLFDKLDSISDEASNKEEGEIPIILLCSERRERGEQMLVKLFSIGVYDAILGNDRTTDNVCKLINSPRTKKDAKIYYKIDSDDAEYKSENAEDVSETEIQNILNHYKKLGKNESKYIESFDSIATQYTDAQLKIIVGFLPLKVRAVLEEQCPKYQELMVGSVKNRIKKDETIITKNIKTTKKLDRIDIINKALEKPIMTNPVIIPASVDTNNVKKVYNTPVAKNSETIIEGPQREEIISNQQPQEHTLAREVTSLERNEITSTLDELSNMLPGTQTSDTQTRRGRGRPPKVVKENSDINTNSMPNSNVSMDSNFTENRIEPQKENTVLNQQQDQTLVATPVRRGRGRPRKEYIQEDVSSQQPQAETNDIQNDDVNLFGLSEDNSTLLESKTNNNNLNDDEFTMLPGLDDNTTSSNNDSSNPTNNFETDNTVNSSNTNPSMDNISRQTDVNVQTSNTNTNLSNNQQARPWGGSTVNTSWQNNEVKDVVSTNYSNPGNLANLLTGDKKIVAFVGTSKNGTSFLVNNLAAMLASKGIKTAILDLTQNKNAYYIYTQNDETIRNQAINSIEGLRMGKANGIDVSKNLSVYTTLPNEEEQYNDYSNILETLAKNYSLVLMDCDFNTNYNYFAQAQEVYLVQTYDILTIQPLTAFLRELEDRNLINPNKLRIVINKSLKVKNLNEKMIIGGISRYNSPDMTYQKELFDVNTIIYATIPFEDQTYSKYLECLVTCEISLNGYSKGLLESLSNLASMVYPLISSKQSFGTTKNYNDYNKNASQFNGNINSTLNKMRNNY